MNIRFLILTTSLVVTTIPLSAMYMNESFPPKTVSRTENMLDSIKAAMHQNKPKILVKYLISFCQSNPINAGTAMLLMNLKVAKISLAQIKDADEWTPLHWAVHMCTTLRCKPEIIKLLLEATGSDSVFLIKMKTKFGESALDFVNEETFDIFRTNQAEAKSIMQEYLAKAEAQ